MILVSQQQLQVIFGLAFQHMITAQDLPIALLLPPHLARVLRVRMLIYLARFTQQKIHLSTRIPFSIALKDLGLDPWEMVPVATALPRIAHCTTFLQGEALQNQLPCRMLHVRRLVCDLFIRKLGNRKVQRVQSFLKGKIWTTEKSYSTRDQQYIILQEHALCY